MGTSDLFHDRIETERLVLEPLTTETVDTLDLYEHVRVGTPHIGEVTEYLTWDPHETPRETREFVEGVTEERGAGDGATYVIRPGEAEDGAGDFAGVAGLSVD